MNKVRKLWESRHFKLHFSIIIFFLFIILSQVVICIALLVAVITAAPQLFGGGFNQFRPHGGFGGPVVGLRPVGGGRN